jgi:ribosomal protein S12 methylthiotransferase accessory factor YcaO
MSRQLGGATDAWELPDGDSIAFPTAPGARIERVEAAVRAQLPLEAEITVDGLAVVAGRTHRLGLLELVEHAAASQIARERDRMPAADDITLRNAAIAHLRAVAEEHGDDPRSS